MIENIILIGPIGVGKTTVSNILSKDTGMKVCHIDDIRNSYFIKLGYSRIIAFLKLRFKGELSLYRYWKKFEVYSLENIMSDHPNHIIDCGAGFSVYEKQEYFDKAKRVFSKYGKVILLVPTCDKEDSIRLLEERAQSELNRLFIMNDSNEKLKDYVIYTDGKKPQEVANEIKSIIS